MIRLLPMQPDEMEAIQRKHRAILAFGKREHFPIRQRLIGFAGFLDR
jgi:hypothetical protein